MQCIDLRRHEGVHPRFGAVDVVPFVPLEGDGSPARPGADLGAALEARLRFARWAGEELGVPCFFYGPERSLPEVRRDAFTVLRPDTGPSHPHPSAGACAVGGRPALVAYNLWLATTELATARSVARHIRSATVRALGMAAGGTTQVSCNLVDPWLFGPADAFDAVRRLARAAGTRLVRAELVGLAPASVVGAVPSARLADLDLDPDRTVEARLRGVRD